MQSRFRLLSLPRELRDEILRLAVQLTPRPHLQGKASDKTIATYGKSTGTFFISGPTKLLLTSSSLLLTSRQINAETRAVLHRLGASASEYQLEIRCLKDTHFEVRWKTVPVRSSQITRLNVRFVVPNRPDDSGSRTLLYQAANNLVWLCHRLTVIFILKSVEGYSSGNLPSHIKILDIDFVSSQVADPRFSNFQRQALYAAALGTFFRKTFAANLYSGRGSRNKYILARIGVLRFRTKGVIGDEVDFGETLKGESGTSQDLNEFFLAWKERVKREREQNGLVLSSEVVEL
ncbi:hypothetical protein P154DRAFT_328039 [Amniculicola lignicola CBS 123094]|uniref:F-box domain-containing protein n=1 Tax=Amniculicola lignicola CBS 123094 TaxID=1392246 RepID=A0A6A5W4M7_9PLEO|nr:hypothetical protein P154DRAFT_328039 [Amniculicola lignicola CBS 123094]